MTDVTTAQKIACEDMLRDVAALARQVEAAGGPAQGHRLSEFARYVAVGNIGSAMVVRDQIRRDLDLTKTDWVELGLAIALLVPIGGFFGILIIKTLWNVAVWSFG